MWFDNFFNINTSILNTDGKKSRSKLNKYKNNFVFMNEFQRNLNDALHRYKIDNLPDTVSGRVVLQSMVWYGFCYFFEKDGCVLALPGAPDGSGLNIYGDFSGAWVYGMNGFNERIDTYLPGSDESAFLKKTISGRPGKQPKGVMVRENEQLYPFINQVIYYSEQMSDTLRKIETARKNSAVPYMIAADEKAISTVKKYLSERDNNEDAIAIDTGVFPVDRINLLPFDIQPTAITALTGVYDWLSNHYRELCSTESCTNLDKKGENLLTSEVTIGHDYTQKQGTNILDTIQKGLDDCNKLFGTNMTVGMNEEEYEDDDISGDKDEDEGIPGGDADGSDAESE